MHGSRIGVSKSILCLCGTVPCSPGLLTVQAGEHGGAHHHFSPVLMQRKAEDPEKWFMFTCHPGSREALPGLAAHFVTAEPLC